LLKLCDASPKDGANCCNQSVAHHQKSVVRCAESHGPFELFASENCEPWNEAKMNVTFERGSARDPRRSPLSAELNDASV